MSADGQDRLHEMLCAYLLGEVNDDERTTVEAALADSAELRAERTRLESTIGLVQDAFPTDETLSDQALEKLMAAAGGARGQGFAGLRLVGGGLWYQAPAVRAAAAVVALLGGVFGLLEYPTGQGANADAVAAVDETFAPRGEVVRMLLEDVAEVRALNDAYFKRHIAESLVLAKQKSEAEQEEVIKLLALTYGALVNKDYEQAHLWAEVARDKPQGNADLGLLVRLTERRNDDALELVAKLHRERVAVYSMRHDPPLSAGIAGLDLVEGNMWMSTEESRLPWADGELTMQEKDGDVRSLQETDPASPRELHSRARSNAPTGGGQPVSDAAEGVPGVVQLGVRGGESAAPASELARGIRQQQAGQHDKAALGDEAKDQQLGQASGLGLLGEKRKESGGGDFGVNAPSDSLAAAKKRVQTGKDGKLESAGSRGPETLSVASDLKALPESERLGRRPGLSLQQLNKGVSDEGGENSFYFASGEQAELEDLDELDRRAGVRRVLTPPEIEQRVNDRFDAIRTDSLPQPGEQPHEMFFRWWGDNPFVLTGRDHLATFSVDVDTASYVLARRYLNDGYLPQKTQVRTEEFVNYFRPDLPAPTASTFGISTELAPSPFGGGGAQMQLLRVGVRGKEVMSYERKPLVLTFVVDTSGSMRKGNRLNLVKHAMGLLLTQLDARDMIGVVTYAKEANQLLPPTSASNRGLFDSLVGPLQPNGGTNAEAGLTLGYEVATRAYDPQADNRVVFLSDGVANIGETDQDRINDSIERHREKYIFLNTIGVGMETHNDEFLEQLADKGDGICDYIDDERAAERAIVERFSGAFTPIASDVKIQVEFDPNQVLRYRLLGYENRAIADVDFRNDAVDAGEVGAGHQVTALFEIERGNYGSGNPLATVRLRWQPTAGTGGPATELEHQVYGGMASPLFSSASFGFQRAALAAQFADFLRGSVHAEQDSYARFLAEVERVAMLPALAADPDTQEFYALVRKAGALVEQVANLGGELERTVDDYRRYQYLREELKGAERLLGREDLRALEQTEQGLEGRLRGLIREEVRNTVR